MKEAASKAGKTGDVAIWGQGDRQGYHLYFSRGEERWAWRALATIQPPSSASDSWIGYQCLTGNGKRAVVVVAPRQGANSPIARDRGALAYVVSLPSGKVRPLAQRVALKYHSPGCGMGNRAVLSRSLGRDQESTELITADAKTAKLVDHARVDGQVTSAVPVGRRVWAASAEGVVDVTTGKRQLLHRTRGRAFSLRPRPGGVDLLIAEGARAQLARVTGHRKSQVLGDGDVKKIALFGGRGGQNIAVGVARWKVENSAGLQTLRAPSGAVTETASLDGSMALSFPLRADRASKAANDAAPGAPSMKDAGSSSLLPQMSDHAGVRIGRPDLGEPAGDAFIAVPMAVAPGLVATKSDAVTPKCAVPRNDVRRQVSQPNAARVNWAIQQATRNLLQGSVLTRPANFANMGLAAFQPSSDFSRGTLAGNASAPVPPQLISAIYAQESAWHQASFRALAGVSGNPLVGDYYGALGTLDRIEYNDADCGYGISQVTDNMSTAATGYSANGKSKVAVDYTENIAAGIQVMVSKWNQLAAAGLLMNNGDPQYVENWYFAAWAYNSGFYPNTGSGPWGLGWTNNPRNADYPPNRQPFLRATYADAERPNEWPYQERIFGWMETPMMDYKGVKAYQTAGILTPPSINTFCTPAGNECDPTYANGALSYCKRADRKCWWHTSVAPHGSNLHAGSFNVATTATEPANDDNYPPACSSTLPSSAIIVDNQPSNLNVEGCGASNWTSEGLFQIQYGANASGHQLGQIDFHQLGTGFGGHTWFTKNRAATDTAHVNTGTWTPPALNGIYTIKAHIPPSGASTGYATYVVHRGDGTTSTVQVNQHIHENRWVSIGTFTLQAGAKVVLNNVTQEPPGTSNVAMDAMAFYKVTGSPVTKTFDATTTFDENTKIDTDTYGIGSATKPMNSHANMFEWGSQTTYNVTQYLACTGTTRNAGCVGPASRAAYAAWAARVSAAGNAWSPTQPSDTIPRWMNFSSPDPPNPLTATWLQNRSNYKVRNRMKVDFRQVNGQIDPQSVTVRNDFQTGDTHLPSMVLDIMRAYRDDYGITMPDLSYTASDLNEWDHVSKRVDPALANTTAGRAYRPKEALSVLTDGGTCVRVRAVTGGAIGLKPMVKSAAVRNAVAAWVGRVADAVTAGRAPAAIRTGAEEINKVVFSDASLKNPFAVDVNSPFHFAPPIWVQQDARFCADGTVKPGNGQIADSGYMPDLYLSIDGTRVGLNGQPTSGPAQLGDFQSFAHVPQSYAPGVVLKTPWNACKDTTLPNFVHRRDGSPWYLEFSTGNDQLSTGVRFCDENLAVGSEVHETP